MPTPPLSRPSKLTWLSLSLQVLVLLFGEVRAELFNSCLSWLLRVAEELGLTLARLQTGGNAAEAPQSDLGPFQLAWCAG